MSDDVTGEVVRDGGGSLRCRVDGRGRVRGELDDGEWIREPRACRGTGVRSVPYPLPSYVGFAAAGLAVPRVSPV